MIVSGEKWENYKIQCYKKERNTGKGLYLHNNITGYCRYVVMIMNKSSKVLGNQMEVKRMVVSKRLYSPVPLIISP